MRSSRIRKRRLVGLPVSGRRRRQNRRSLRLERRSLQEIRHLVQRRSIIQEKDRLSNQPTRLATDNQRGTPRAGRGHTHTRRARRRDHKGQREEHKGQTRRGRRKRTNHTRSRGILFHNGTTLIPDILANSGGVSTSYLEWVQNLQHLYWTADEVDHRLKNIMVKAFAEVYKTSQDHNVDMRTGAYIQAIGKV